MAASVAQAGAIAVKSTTGLVMASGVWTGVILFSVTALITLIKIVPKLREIANLRRATDMERLDERVTELEGAVAIANKTAHHAEMSMVTLVAALQLVMGEVEKLDPGNKVLVQAREMVAAARTGDFGMNQAIDRLATVAAVRRA